MEPRAESLLPEQFGPLQGVRILSTGTLIAQPFAATLAAEMGAEVIQIERPGIGDVTRGLGVPMGDVDGSPVGSLWAQDRRNTFYTTLDFAAPEGRDLFLRLITGADIWMESSKAGTYAQWSLDDATVLAANPSIVITHVSGYGQTGHPDYLNRASYDPIGQAFGAYQAKDGWVVIAAIGAVFGRMCRVLELDPTDEHWRQSRTELESIAGIEFDAILRGWLEDRTVKEVVEILNDAQVGCSAVMTPKDIAEDPHYQAREVHAEWEDLQLGRKVKGIGIVPKFSATPGKIWRGSAPLGYDNDSVYRHFLGMEELEQLRVRGII